MSVIPKNIGAYEVLREIGRGGMGVVYLGRDGKLERDVAIKVLPEDLGQDADRLARFEREARLLASLHHSNIAAVYGLEEIDGVRYLVLEYVEGEDLSDRLRPGALPIDEALHVGSQIAAAVGAAHDKGVIHRDLKPANVKINDDGEVKVLDFGLAKSLGETSISGAPSSPTVAPGAASPTMPGVILGTAGYMSPEQAKGKPIDKRTDIWSFGCMLYEMLTGECPFPGDTVTESLGATIHKDPDWQKLPPGTPPSVQLLLRRCLQKDRGRRLHDIGDARIEIEETLTGTTVIPADLVPDRPRKAPSRRDWLWIAASMVPAVLALVFGVLYFRQSDPAAPMIRAAVPAPDNALYAFSGDRAGPVVVSPDGRMLAFTAVTQGEDGQRVLWVRPLDAATARPLPGTDGAHFPFWSPDSRSLAFFTDLELKRINVAGGPAMTVCDSPNGRGGTWSREGFILFAPEFRSAIHRVAVSGGEPVPVTVFDESLHTSHRWPFMLPDGKHFLYAAIHHEPSRADDNGIYIASVDGGEPKRIVHTNANAEYAAGHLVYLQEHTLVATPLDPEAGQFTGDPVAIASDISASLGTWRASFSVSPGGLLAYHPGTIAWGEGLRLVWYDRSGQQQGTIEHETSHASLRIGPKGDRLVFATSRGLSIDLWTYDLTRDVGSRLTSLQGTEVMPAWSPDGQEIVFGFLFATGSGQRSGIYRIPAGGGTPELLLADEDDDGLQIYPNDWSGDGRFIVYMEGKYMSSSATNIWVLPLDGDVPFPFMTTEFDEGDATFSPDGRWIAYASQRSGRLEVYVAPFTPPSGSGAGTEARPAIGRKVSTGGGGRPRWSPDGNELFYVSGNMLMVAEVSTAGDRFEIGATRPLFAFNMGPGNTYDISPDGDRLLMSLPAEASSTPIELIINWTALLD